VAIGASTGGPKALIELVAGLPADLNAALFVVQHMPKTFITPFARRMASRTPLRCCVGEEGQAVEPGVIYVAQGETHMILAGDGPKDLRISHSQEPRTLFVPSVNVTMKAVAERFGHRSVGVILTGMGNDGAQGILTIRRLGGRTIAESHKSAVVYGMPQEAVKLGGVEASLPLPEIPKRLIQFVNEGNRE
jgi:two-component system chemotaxis response regulator CheB